MKIAILGDLHFGCRKSSADFHKYQKRFFTETFFPYLVENDIDTVFQLGDFFDTRKHINLLTLSEVKKWFLNPLVDNNIQLITLLGNHDIHFKELVSVNSPSLILTSHESNVEVIESCKEILLDGNGLTGLFVPWICKENQSEVEQRIQETKATICFGHFEFKGFEVFRGHMMETGYDPGLMGKFDKVISGHYHHRSQNGNILYVGTPYELTWMDYGDIKGFHVLDTETQELEFVENPFTMFHKIVYNGEDVDFDKYANSFIRLIAPSVKDPFHFEKFISRLQSLNPLDLKIIDDVQVNAAEDQIEDLEVDSIDTFRMIETFIDAFETEGVKKEEVKRLMRQLYVEAQSSGD